MREEKRPSSSSNKDVVQSSNNNTEVLFDSNTRGVPNNSSLREKVKELRRRHRRDLQVINNVKTLGKQLGILKDEEDEEEDEQY